MEISFQTQNCCFLVDFNQSPAAQEIVKHLPLDSKVSIWGDEIYFETGILAPDQGETLDVSVGDVAYWPQGHCLCVFFGPTPASSNGKPIPASPVVIIGRTATLPDELKKIQAGHSIRLMPVQVMPVASSEAAVKNEKKLSQSEIDVLVQQLLAEKEKNRK